jgi:hypothetical protein
MIQIYAYSLINKIKINVCVNFYCQSEDLPSLFIDFQKIRYRHHLMFVSL